MKRITLSALFGLAMLTGCTGGDNNSTNGTSHNADSAAGAGSSVHGGHGGTASGGPTMMSLMHGNMEGMKAIPSTGNADRDFAALMRVHHQGAVDMAELLLTGGKDTMLQTFARQIIADQQREIAQFDAFLKEPAKASGQSPFYKEAIAAMDTMHMNMHTGGSLDWQFAQMMIPHHQSGIDMAQTYLKRGASSPGLMSLANNIILTQRNEIAVLKSWLERNP
jgi:uncharacterized protein (DUF305 family)